MPPESRKLQAEKAAGASGVAVAEVEDRSGPLQIREVECLNEFVAILQSEINIGGSIALPDVADKHKYEGIVIGVGRGIYDGVGGCLSSQVEIGDVVMFGKNIITVIESSDGPYAGQKVVVVSERNLICKLSKKVDWIPYVEGD